MSLEVNASQMAVVGTESHMTAEFVDGMDIQNSISSEPMTTTITTEDGSTLPVTLIMSQSDVSDKFDSNEVPDNQKSDVQESPANESSTQYVIEHITLGEVMQQTLYAIQFADGDSPGIEPEELDNDKDVVESPAESTTLEVQNVEDECARHQMELHTMETTTRLEDFMDVVTTYKCKFCRFSCPWKSGLMSHIRNCHLEANKPVSSLESGSTNGSGGSIIVKTGESEKSEAGKSQNENESKSSDVPENGPEHDDAASNTQAKENVTVPPPPQERHIFLCGQCRMGFSSLQACKNHMIQDHNIKLEFSKPKAKGDSLLKKRKKAKATSCISPNGTNDSPLIEENNQTELTAQEVEQVNKRKIRRPKCLEDDFFLGVKRRRVKRECASDKIYRCNEKGCGYRFSAENALDYHITCHQNGEKFFLCPECTEKVEHWRGLSLHLWKEHAIDVDLHTCQECGYKTHSHFKLENHRRIHSDERLYVCSKCNKGFKQLSQLRNHYVIHIDRKNLPEKRWYSEQKCDICERTFSDSKCLRKHQQAVHNKIKPYVCTYCGHMSARKAMLQLHMRQHTGEKPFMCEHCEYRTGDHNSLRRHRMRHTGTKPYKCPHCSYACIQAISYKTHLKNKHPGMEGLFACTLCSFRSVSKDNYINHMSDHKRGVIPGTQDEADGASTSTCVNCDCLNSLGEGYCPNHSSDHKSGALDDHVGASNHDSSIDEAANQNSSLVHLTENTLQQLEGILPGNITAAQLIYSCLNALSQEGGSVSLPAGVTAAVTGDGSQTITIQLPTAQEIDSEQYYFTIQQQNDGSSAVLPSDLSEGCCVDESGASSEVLYPITIMQDDVSENQALDSSVFIGDGQLGSSDTNSIIIEHSESLAATVDEDTSGNPNSS